MPFEIAVLPGDGIGPEVIEQAVRSDGPRQAIDRVWLEHPFFNGVRRDPERFASLRDILLDFLLPRHRKSCTR